MSHRFEVVSTQLLVDAPIIALRRDRLTMPGGGESDREIVEHFGAVAVVAVDEQGRIAMVEQYRHSVGRRLWELPAGILDIHEEEEIATAQRELKEEAGLAAGTWGVLVDLVTSPGFAEEAVRVFIARDLHAVERPEAEHEEADMGFDWVPLEEAKRKVMSGEIVNSIAVAGILAAAEVEAGRATARGVDEPFDLRPSSLPQRRAAAGVVPDMKRIGR